MAKTIGESTSKVIINGLSGEDEMQYKTFNNILANLIDENRDKDGNIIDPDREDDIVNILRQAILKCGIPDKDKVLDYIKPYELSKSERVKKATDVSIRFIEKVSSTTLNEWIPKWENSIRKALKGSTANEQLAIGNIIDWVYEYLKGDI